MSGSMPCLSCQAQSLKGSAARGYTGLWVLSTFWVDGYTEDLFSISLGCPFCCAYFPVGSMSLEISRKKNRVGGRKVEIPDRTRQVFLTKEDFVPHG